MSTIAGHCGKCGAPYSIPDSWSGTIAPPCEPTCACWNISPSFTSNTVGQYVQFDNRSAVLRFLARFTSAKIEKCTDEYTVVTLWIDGIRREFTAATPEAACEAALLRMEGK